jgi:hypothetical protein
LLFLAACVSRTHGSADLFDCLEYHTWRPVAMGERAFRLGGEEALARRGGVHCEAGVRPATR